MTNTTLHVVVYLAISLLVLSLARKWPAIFFWPLNLTHDQRYVGFAFEPAAYHLTVYSILSVGFIKIHQILGEGISRLSETPPLELKNWHEAFGGLLVVGAIAALGTGILFPLMSLFIANWILRGFEFFYGAELSHRNLEKLGDHISGSVGHLSTSINEVRFILSRPKDEIVHVVDTLNKALKALDDIRPNSNGMNIPLVISSDTKMLTQLFGIQATPFFLVAQRLWYEKYWKTEAAGYFSNLRDRSGNELNTALEGMFDEGLAFCLNSMQANFKQLFDVNPQDASMARCKVRAIRLVFGNAGELVDRARYLQPLLSARILDPSESSSYPGNGILNVWINGQLATKIKPKAWTKNPKERVLRYFNPPTVDWEGVMRELLKKLNVSSSGFFDRIYQYKAGRYESDFLAIGGRMFKPGYAESGELKVESEPALAGFLSCIPSSLMALNFRYVLPFDDLIAFLGRIDDDQEIEQYKRLLENYPEAQIRSASRKPTGGVSAVTS